MVEERFGTVHAVNHTPSTAVLWLGAVTGACMFLGQAILVPITEVGSVASAIGWTAACASYFAMKPAAAKTAVALVGVLLGIGMILMKIVPLWPGHFTIYEWIALGVWVGVGLVLRKSAKASEASAVSRGTH